MRRMACLCGPIVKKLAAEPTKHIRLFPEASLSIEMDDLFAPYRKILVNGRADQALGYSKDTDDGALLMLLRRSRGLNFLKEKLS